MMRSSRPTEKGKAPAYANSIPNVDEDSLDSILDMPLSISSWEDIHRSVAQGVPEPVGNPRVYSVNPSSLQNRQTNAGSNPANANLQEVPLLSDWNVGWGQQDMNQRDTAPFHIRNNVNFNTNQSEVQGKFEGSFLSLGLGGTSDSVSGSQLGSRNISDKLKEAASNELKMASTQKATGKTFDDGLVGSQSSNSGFSNQFSHVSHMNSGNNDDGVMGSSSHHILQMQQNDRQFGRADKLTEAVSTELKLVHAKKPTGQTLDADFMEFERNNSGFSNQFSNVNRMTSTDYEVGVHSALNSGQGSSPHHVSQMQQNDSRNIRSSYLDYHKRKASVHSGTLGGSYAHVLNSKQHNLKTPEFVKPSWMNSYHTPSGQLHHFRSTTSNSPNNSGQVVSQNATPTQVLGGNLFSQKTATPQVSWVGRGLAGIDAPFPKRLGVMFSARNCPQSSLGHPSPMETSLQTTSTGQICEFSDTGSTRMSHNVHRHIGQSDGAPVSYPVNYQEPVFTFGQTQNAPTQLPKGPQGVPSINASTVNSQSQMLDFHVGPHHKRTALASQSTSHWVRRQKIMRPTIHHSMPKPPIPVTSALVHPSISVGSRSQRMGPVVGPVSAHIHPVISRASNAKSHVPVASTPAVSHITWKDPDATSKLSGYKCFLCKRDLALTSEGAVFQPAASPPVAILPCGHAFHDQCLQNITPDDQAKDPPCIPCAIGEN